MLKRLVLVLLSAAGFAAAGSVVCKTLARLQGRAVGATLATLDGTARALEAALTPTGNDLPELAAHLAGAPKLGDELRLLAAAKAAVAAAKGPAVAAHARLDTARAKLDQHLAALRAALPGVDGLMVLGDTGEVLSSDLPAFAVGQELAAPAGGDGAGGDAFAALGDAASITGPARARAPLQAALGGTSARAAFVDDGRLTWVATAPVMLKVKNELKIVGAVLVRRQLSALPRAAADAFVTVDGKAVLGTLPALAHLPLNPPERPFVLAASDVQLPVYAPVLAEAVVSAGSPAGEPRAGLWAARFRVAGIDEAHGFVTADLATAWSEVAQAQTRVVTLGAALWVIHAALLLLLGARLRRGVGRITQLAAAAAQGGPAPALDEKQVVAELRPLALALLALVRRVAGAPAESTATSSTAAAAGAPAVERVADDPVTAVMRAPAPLPVDDDGFRPLTESTELPIVTDPAGLDGRPVPLPGAAESMSAVEQLAAPPPALDLAYEPPPPPVALDDNTPVAPPPVPLERPVAPGPSAAGFDEVTRPRGVGEPLGIDAGVAGTPAAALVAEPGPAELEPASLAKPAAEPVAEPVAKPVAEPVVEPAEVDAPVAASPLADAPFAPPLADPPAAPAAGDDAPAPDESAVFALAREVAQRPLSSSSRAALDERPPAAALRDDGLSISTDDTGEHQALARPGRRPSAASDNDPTSVSPPPRPPASPRPPARTTPPTPEESERVLRAVYEEFVAVRQSCGESGELPFDRFRARLDESRAAVIAKHACKDVRFQVYVKNGRAAIKATPG